MLEVEGLNVAYGPIGAVKGIDLRVEAGEIVALIGANGAGKTSILKALAGLLPFGGVMKLDGKRVQPGQAEQLVRRGLMLVPEGRGILAQMSVGENLLMGAYSRPNRRNRSELLVDRAEVLRRFPVLGKRLQAGAGLLSGGEQQMLAIGRALMARPRLLMLDEPSLGLAPLIVDQVFRIVEDLRKSAGITILLVEQKARQALTVADRAYVLENGKVVAEGPAARIAGGSLIEDVFLGRSPAKAARALG